MLLVRPPGVYPPQGDSHLLRDALTNAALPPGAAALDVCTGTGLLAVAAARLGAGQVSAVDISASAVLAARCNAWLRRLPIRVHHGDFLSCAAGRRYDVVTANPPYVPCPRHAAWSTRRARSWDAGEDGRWYLDRLCAAAPHLLKANGMLLMVHSALCGPAVTVRMLRDTGLKTSVVARRRQPFGPVLLSRAGWLEDQGLIAPGQREEELVVIRADRVPSPS
ncbi:HemK2/MTQ2 family protein methyltransferase [Streptomyces sp. NPDC004647]|uniref:HemK2/MTQ2 family protein methyltransferase n=1 Tax=Streptomyces sp. NPDC004647 TaxID=3154671 RepID=UPI0033A8989F